MLCLICLVPPIDLSSYKGDLTSFLGGWGKGGKLYHLNLLPWKYAYYICYIWVNEYIKILDLTTPLLIVVNSMFVGPRLQQWTGLQVYECVSDGQACSITTSQWVKQEKILKLSTLSEKLRILWSDSTHVFHFLRGF